MSCIVSKNKISCKIYHSNYEARCEDDCGRKRNDKTICNYDMDCCTKGFGTEPLCIEQPLKKETWVNKFKKLFTSKAK